MPRKALSPKLRRGLWLFLAVFVVLIAADNFRTPERQVSARVLLAAIGAYQHHLASHVPSHCRFEPTCSEYARLAVGKYGAVRGGLKASWRVIRCSPLTKNPGKDYP
ncbi:MAG: membrane protein insertion efficiency factor YidD [Deltaproteobacteria bacterium]|nr:membrane protein insertion efficiency factor YidD [Deltaproteobacteria bacterium]